MDKLSVSQEDYLKEIYRRYSSGEPVRITDIALSLGISKPSVNKAVKLLMQMGYISHEHYGDIQLTPSGMEVGKEITENFKVSRKFLVEILGVPEETADMEAHGMEHVLSKGTRKKLKRYMKKLKKQTK